MVSSRVRAERAGTSTVKRNSDPSTWNSMDKGLKQLGLASTGCLIGVHRGLTPKSGTALSNEASVSFQPPQPRNSQAWAFLQTPPGKLGIAKDRQLSEAGLYQPHRSHLAASLHKH